MEKEAEWNVGGTKGTNMDNKSDKGESKNEGSTTGSTNFAEAFDCKYTAPSIPQS